MIKQIVVGVVAIAAVSACSKGGDPKAVVSEITGKYDAGNCTGLRDYVVAAQRETGGAAFEQACQAEAQGRAAGAPAQPATVGEATQNGDRATVKVRAGEQDSNMVLVKENGSWKLDLAATS